MKCRPRQRCAPPANGTKTFFRSLSCPISAADSDFEEVTSGFRNRRASITFPAFGPHTVVELWMTLAGICTVAPFLRHVYSHSPSSQCRWFANHSNLVPLPGGGCTPSNSGPAMTYVRSCHVTKGNEKKNLGDRIMLTVHSIRTCVLVFTRRYNGPEISATKPTSHWGFVKILKSPCTRCVGLTR